MPTNCEVNPAEQQKEEKVRGEETTTQRREPSSMTERFRRPYRLSGSL
jgi:hypothetical protein